MDKLTFIIPKKLEDIGIVNAKLTMITTETQVPSAHSSAILLGTAIVQNV